MKIHANKISTAQLHKFILSTVTPRPIGFVSSVSKEGAINLSPFSFFNAFSANPPILIFSPARRIRDNTSKHTLENVKEHPEVTINLVNFPIVEQMSLASTEYDRGINEFVKAGLTPALSDVVKPPFVLEAPAAFECKVREVIELGDQGGAGNLVICEILVIHIKDELLEEDKTEVNPFKLDAVARLGGDWYCRVNGDSLFQIPKPIKNKGIGMDNLPDYILNSKFLTGNNLGRLANIECLPSKEEVAAFKTEEFLNELSRLYANIKDMEACLHLIAKDYLEEGKIQEAWKTLLQQAELKPASFQGS